MPAVTAADAIKYIVSHNSSGRLRFGRTKLMKNLYFLQEVGDVKLGLEFELYTYGPYTATVLQDLDALSVSGEILQKSPRNTDQGYKISLQPGTAIPIIPDGNGVTERLKNRKAKDLEALSTLHMTWKLLEGDEELTVKRVRNFKPYFSAAELRGYLGELKDWGWLAN